MALSEAKIIAALRKWGGMAALAAKELGVSRQAVHQRVKNSPTIQATIAAIEEETLDIGEGHLIKALREGEANAVRFYLMQKGRKRGYGNRIEADIRLSDADIEAVVAAFGADITALRAFRAQLAAAAGLAPPPNSKGADGG